MSQVGGTVSKATIDLTLDAHDLRQRLAEAEGQLQEFRARQVSHNIKDGGPLGGLAETADQARDTLKPIHEIERAIGRISGVISIVVGAGYAAVSAVKAVAESLSEAKVKENGVVASIDEVRAGLEEFDKIGRKNNPFDEMLESVVALQKKQEETAQKSDGTSQDFAFKAALIEKAAAAAARRVGELQRAFQDKNTAEFNRRLQEEINSTLRQGFIQRATEEERISADAGERINKLRGLQDRARSQEDKDRIQAEIKETEAATVRSIESIKQEREREIDEREQREREAREAKERADIESARRVARAILEEQQRTIHQAEQASRDFMRQQLDSIAVSAQQLLKIVETRLKVGPR